MKKDRQLILTITLGAIVGLWALDSFLIEPAIAHWKEQSERIAALRTEVANGQKMLDREKNLRDRWASMMRENLPADDSAAENAIRKAISRWEISAITVNRYFAFTNLTNDKQWKVADDGSQTLSYTIQITGDQASIGRFIYEMESDTLPVSLDKCEITSRDTRGTQLTLAATFSFLRLPQPEKKGS